MFGKTNALESSCVSLIMQNRTIILESVFILMIITKMLERPVVKCLTAFTSRKPNNNNKLTHRKPLYKHSMD